MDLRSRCAVASGAAFLYAASLMLPTASPFNQTFSDTVYAGWEAFQIGWRALLAPVLTATEWWVLAGAWIANPLIWIAYAATLVGWRRVCLFAASVGLVLCLLVLWWYSAMIVRYPGYWLWVGSDALLFAGSCLHWHPSRATAE